MSKHNITKISLKDSAKFLLDSGLLFEINWKVLHPFGLALSVSENDETGEVELEGLIKTDDMAGWEFSDHDFIAALHKLRRFVLNKENIERLSTRKLSLGCTIQNESDQDTHTAPVQEGLI